MRGHDGDMFDDEPEERGMHDEKLDLHVYRADTFGLIHPHTRLGFGYLALMLGASEMARYQVEDNYNPRLTLAAMDKLIESAQQDGLSVEVTTAKGATS